MTGRNRNQVYSTEDALATTPTRRELLSALTATSSIFGETKTVLV